MMILMTGTLIVVIGAQNVLCQVDLSGVVDEQIERVNAHTSKFATVYSSPQYRCNFFLLKTLFQNSTYYLVQLLCIIMTA